MNKPASLRAALADALPWLKKNPDRLLVFIEEGGLACTSARSMSFEYAYTLKVVVTDFAEHPDTVFVPLLTWVSRNQPEILANPERREDITFVAELLDNSKVDMEISIKLTERVVVAALEGGGYTATHVPEPPADPYEGVADVWSLTIRHPNGEQEEV